uniref:Uncharacterized protein n=1 Tax=uncultured Armatimonadetes bacterium TaxID=157466 RepID=A0A6J4IW90_9BACT|nr:hypothetical protein AVDCRST_MAG63-3214 [uncultured Armatimonadetes bacterium]
MRKQQQPDNRRAFDDRMKLHLRVVSVGGRTYRIVTLRPGTEAAFSTNFFHETWHVVSDAAGALLLGRLLWGLAYQRQPGTLVLLHGEHVQPTPFDADPSDPVLLVPAHLTPLDVRALRALKERLHRLGPPQATIRWQTHGLSRFAGDRDAMWDDEGVERLCSAKGEGSWQREQISRSGGFLCYTAPPQVLRLRAFQVHGLDPSRHGMDYHYLADRSGRRDADGEVQVFRDYRRQLSDVRVARREVLAEGGAAVPCPQALRERVWQQRERVVARRNHR